MKHSRLKYHLNFFLLLLIFSLTVSCTKSNYPEKSKIKLEYAQVNDGVMVTAFPLNAEEVIIPAFVTINNKELPVTGISNSINASTVKNLHIPSSVNYIEPDAFANANISKIYIDNISDWCKINFLNSGSKICYSNPINEDTKLVVNGVEISNTLSIPDDVTLISPYAFQRLNIDHLILGKNVKEISDNAFRGCKGLREVEGGENVEKIGNYTFQDTDIKKIALRSPIKSIGNFAFPESLKKIYIPSSVQQIGAQSFPYVENIAIDSFDNWVKIEYVAFPDNETPELSLDKYPPYLCAHNFSINDEIMNSISLPESIKSINDYAFYYAKIKKLELPETLNYMGPKAFDYCHDLDWLTLPGELKTITGFNNCPHLGAVFLKEGIERGEKCFYNCPKLYWFKFPESLKYIDFTFFNGTNAINVLCSAKTPPEVFLQNMDPVFSPTHFLYAPTKSIKSYSNAPGWCNFKFIEPL